MEMKVAHFKAKDPQAFEYLKQMPAGVIIENLDIHGVRKAIRPDEMCRLLCPADGCIVFFASGPGSYNYGPAKDGSSCIKNFN